MLNIHDDYLVAYCEAYPNNMFPRVSFSMYMKEDNKSEFYIETSKKEDYEEGKYLLHKWGKQVLCESFHTSNREEADKRFTAFLTEQNVSKIYKKAGTFEF